MRNRPHVFISETFPTMTRSHALADPDFAAELLVWANQTARICSAFNPDWRPSTDWQAQTARDYQRAMGYRDDQPLY